MRLIDADKLILSLNDNYLANSPTGNETLEIKEYREAMCEGLEIAMATVEGAPTANGWIGVKDRVPNNQNPVIVAVPPHTDAEGEEYIGYVGMAYYTYLPNGGMWCGTDGAVYGAIGEIATPTHWMELPEPPKEESEDATD